MKYKKYIYYVAAFFVAIITLITVWYLYNEEFRYANTKEGRLEVVYDYIPQQEGRTLRDVKVGTEIDVLGYETEENFLLIYYKSKDSQNINGIISLEKGINGKYRTVEADYNPSKYSAGIYVTGFSIRGTDLNFFAIAGDSGGDIDFAKVKYRAFNPDGQNHYYDEKVYTFPDSSFLWLIDKDDFLHELGFNNDKILGVSIVDMVLFDKYGNDITYKYKNEDIETNWSGGKDTEEVSSLYRYIAVTAFLGVVFIIYFLKKSKC